MAETWRNKNYMIGDVPVTITERELHRQLNLWHKNSPTNPDARVQTWWQQASAQQKMAATEKLDEIEKKIDRLYENLCDEAFLRISSIDIGTVPEHDRYYIRECARTSSISARFYGRRLLTYPYDPQNFFKGFERAADDAAEYILATDSGRKVLELSEKYRALPSRKDSQQWKSLFDETETENPMIRSFILMCERESTLIAAQQLYQMQENSNKLKNNM